MFEKTRETARRFARKIESPYFYIQTRLAADLDSLLDVGCGVHSPLSALKPSLKRLTGLDNFKAYVDESSRRNLHHDYVLGSATELHSLIHDKEYDCVASIDVIEHLNREDGYALLKNMERIARRMAIVFTPNGFLPQEMYDDNPGQLHLSGWTTSDFSDLGYKVVGFGGLKYLKGERAGIRFRPIRFWKFVSIASTPIVRVFPRLAFQLLAYKRLR